MRSVLLAIGVFSIVCGPQAQLTGRKCRFLLWPGATMCRPFASLVKRTAPMLTINPEGHITRRGFLGLTSAALASAELIGNANAAKSASSQFRRRLHQLKSGDHEPIVASRIGVQLPNRVSQRQAFDTPLFWHDIPVPGHNEEA